MFFLDITLDMLSIKHEWVYLFVHAAQFNIESNVSNINSWKQKAEDVFDQGVFSF